MGVAAEALIDTRCARKLKLASANQQD